MLKKLALSALIITATSSAAFGATKLNPWQAKALKIVKAEKKVLDAKWRSPESNVLYVSMAPDGSRRDGFAEYLCMTFAEAGAPEGELKSVFIYDPLNYESGNQMMGMAACR